MAYVVQALRSGRPARMRAWSPLALVQPALARIVRHVARTHPHLFDRLGPHSAARFVVDPVDLPFALYLVPDRRAPLLRAVRRQTLPPHDARIAGRFAHLLRTVDAAQDADALFFSRDIQVSGDTEAAVSLRNALDDLDVSLAQAAAGAYGAPGRAALALLRRAFGLRA